MKFTLPTLPYSYNALEPYIDAQTMELHHAKHHATYVAKLNEALDKHPELSEKSLEELLRDLESVPEDIRMAVRNYGGGHYNHSLFWKILAPAGQNRSPIPEILAIKDEFNKKAAGLFGSGWCWLAKDIDGSLKIITTPNQDVILTSGLRPLIVLDLWEHAYYLKYQNRRPEYIEAWWNIVNWNYVKDQYGP